MTAECSLAHSRNADAYCKAKVKTNVASRLLCDQIVTVKLKPPKAFLVERFWLNKLISVVYFVVVAQLIHFQVLLFFHFEIQPCSSWL